MRVMIIGGGAAGMLAASTAAAHGARVTVVEANEKTCRKLCITGRGRCNLTNNCDLTEFMQNTPGNGRFLYGALARFSPQDAMAHFEALGVPLKTERGGRVFPVSDRAYDIADALLRDARERGVRIVQGRVTEIMVQNGRVAGVRTDREGLAADAVIVATGGMSYPLTGSRGDGYALARALGHEIVEPCASLVPLEAPGCAPMQGLALKNTRLRLYGGEKCLFEDFGELLFTHFGLSGPIVLSASARMREPLSYRVELDLKPALDEAALDARILRDFTDAQNRNFGNALGRLLPRLLIPAVVARTGIDPNKKIHAVTRAERAGLLRALKAFEIPITGKRPIDEAIITSGGVQVREVDARTMESRLVRGVYFAGEVLDVDAYTGGFNLQIAWSSGYAAGIGAARGRKEA